MRGSSIHLLLWLTGVVEGLLLARLLARLLAARPDNPSFQLLYGVTGPLIAPLLFLDAGQPRFGATLELSTLALALLVPLPALLALRLMGRRATTLP